MALQITTLAGTFVVAGDVTEEELVAHLRSAFAPGGAPAQVRVDGGTLVIGGGAGVVAVVDPLRQQYA